MEGLGSMGHRKASYPKGRGERRRERGKKEGISPRDLLWKGSRGEGGSLPMVLLEREKGRDVPEHGVQR